VDHKEVKGSQVYLVKPGQLGLLGHRASRESKETVVLLDCRVGTKFWILASIRNFRCLIIEFFVKYTSSQMSISVNEKCKIH